MPQHCIRRKPQLKACSQNTFHNFTVAAGDKAFADAIVEQRPMQPTAFDEGPATHNHARADHAVNFAGRFAEVLLGKAGAQAFKEVRRRLFPIENHAPADAARLWMRPDCLCNGIHPTRVEQVVVIDKGNPWCRAFLHTAPPSRRESLLALYDAPQTGQKMVRSLRDGQAQLSQQASDGVDASGAGSHPA